MEEMECLIRPLYVTRRETSVWYYSVKNYISMLLICNNVAYWPMGHGEIGGLFHTKIGLFHNNITG